VRETQLGLGRRPAGVGSAQTPYPIPRESERFQEALVIYVRFVGQLGNQMFQYAAARLAAERLGCPFIVTQAGFTWRDYVRRREKIQLFRSYPELHRGLAMNLVSAFEHHLEGPSAWIKDKVFRTEFRPWSPETAPWEGLEGFDPAYRTLPRFTRLVGYFQSPLYMSGREDAVRTWFARSSQEALDVAARWSALGLDPERTVAVHVRLGDYRHQVPLGHNPDGGWILPQSYYRDALERIGPDVKIALFSDEPDTAAQYIGKPADYISRTEDIRLDFLMMSSCKYMITANSTFSWWAAWLNSTSDPVIIAPEFFLGRNLSEWYPRDIRVEGWRYV